MLTSPVAGYRYRRVRKLYVARPRLGRSLEETMTADQDDHVATAPPASALIIDALGRKCPIPIIWLAERIREVPVGALISVLADDPAARTDLPAWCGLKSQEFVVETTLPRGWAFTVRRCY